MSLHYVVAFQIRGGIHLVVGHCWCDMMGVVHYSLMQIGRASACAPMRATCALVHWGLAQSKGIAYHRL